MPYLVIDADRVIVSGGILGTQTAADTLAATESAWTAHQGDVTGASFHANAEPGWFLTTAGVTVAVLPLSALQELKNTMNEAHHYTVQLQADLHHEGSGRLWEEVVKVHDYFARTHQSHFQIVHENPNSLSVADRTAYAIALLAGPPGRSWGEADDLRAVQPNQQLDRSAWHHSRCHIRQPCRCRTAYDCVVAGSS